MTGFINRVATARGQKRRYVVYVPWEYDSDKTWPLILFLHGRGERGDDGLSQTEVGIGRAIRLWPDRFPALVVFPQCPGAVYWDKAREDIDCCFNDVLDAYSVDSSRIYLTGISMGGYATWWYASHHPERFAALLPICGGGDGEWAKPLTAIPVWAFHGVKDTAVLPSESANILNAFKAAGGKAKFTEYPNLEHNSWDETYANPKVIRWLLKQRKA